MWDNCTLYDANLLESVQVEAARIITGLRINSSKTKLYKELGWEALFKRRENHRLVLMFKIINGLAQNYLNCMVQPYTTTIHAYNLRQPISNDHIRVPICNTQAYSNSFLPSTIRAWNSLPTPTKNSPSVNVFKSRLLNNCPKAPAYFNIGNRRENIWLCQLRNEASNLNKHLFLHHLTDNQNCPHCRDCVEDNKHFLLSCDYYAHHRRSLQTVCLNFNINFDLPNLLYGNEGLNNNENEQIMLSVQNYIKNTKRFE